MRREIRGAGLKRQRAVWQEIAQAIGLMLVIEGILPFLYPRRWRTLVETLSRVEDSQMRLMGLASMIFGLIVLFLLK